MPVATTSVSTSAVRVPTVAAVKLYCGGQEPAFLLALEFSIGIITGNYVWRSPIAWLTAFLAAIAGAMFFHRRSPQITFALSLLAVVPLSGFYVQARDAAQPAIAQNLQPFATAQD